MNNRLSKFMSLDQFFTPTILHNCVAKNLGSCRPLASERFARSESLCILYWFHKITWAECKGKVWICDTIAVVVFFASEVKELFLFFRCG
jgi:hypothetical protein